MLPRKPKKKTTKSGGLSTLVRKLDKIFSEYIRLRDSRPYAYKYFKCISCGQIKEYKKADCGHFFSRRHMATRFDEDNCHSECSFCNRMNAEHLYGYQKNLVAKIGQKRFDALVVRHTMTKKFTTFELEELIKYYTILVKSMKP